MVITAHVAPQINSRLAVGGFLRLSEIDRRPMSTSPMPQRTWTRTVEYPVPIGYHRPPDAALCLRGYAVQPCLQALYTRGKCNRFDVGGLIECHPTYPSLVVAAGLAVLLIRCGVSVARTF
jgi:hypothetical protein